MENKVLISVIIPVYNVEKYLAKCLDSLVNQSYKALEFIFVNDGSEDSSLDILYDYAQRDERIRVINQDNRGQGTARNRGIRAAQGEYISFIDSDDFVERNLFEECFNSILKNSPDVIVFGVKTFYENNGKIRQGQYSARSFNRCDFWKYHTISCNKLYKKQFLTDNNISFAVTKTGEEQLFFLKTMLLAKNIDVLKKDLYFYRKNRTGALTSAKKRIDFSPIENFYKIEEFVNVAKINSDLKLEILSHYILKAISWYSKTDISVKNGYYERLVAALEFLKQRNGKYWWDYFQISPKASYIALKLEYIKSLILYFIREKLIYIPAAFCFFVCGLIGKDE